MEEGGSVEGRKREGLLDWVSGSVMRTEVSDRGVR